MDQSPARSSGQASDPSSDTDRDSFPTVAEEGDGLSRVRSRLRALRQPNQFLLIIAAAVFVGEALVMFALHWIRPQPLWAEALLDAFLITIIILPMLDWFLLRPMTAQIAIRRQAEESLRGEITERVQAEMLLELTNQHLMALSRVEHEQRSLAEAMTEATAALNSSLDLDEVLDRVLDQTKRVVPCRALAILLLQNSWVDVPRHRDGTGPWYVLETGFSIDRFPMLRVLAESSDAYVIPDVEQFQDWPEITGTEWVRSLMLAPLVEKGHTIGFLMTASEQQDFFQGEITKFLTTFATYAAVAINHAAVYRAELRARQTAEILATTSMALTQTLELQSVLDLFLENLYQLIPYSRGSVALLESETHLVVRAHKCDGCTADAGSPEAVVLDLSKHPRLQALLKHQQGASGGRDDAPSWLTHTGASELSWLAVPILGGGHALGLCTLETNQRHFFTDEHLRIAHAVVAQAAIAVQNAWLFQQVRAGRERLQSLSHRLVQVQESERTYVARELHDDAGQALASLMLGLGQLERDAQDPSKVIAGVREIHEIADGVLEDLHRLAMDLRPASLDYLGLAPALGALINKLQRLHQIPIQFKVVGWSEERLAAEIEVSLYRIVQEALTNIVRHAKATHVDVLLQRDGRGVILTVEDDGVGFNVEGAKSANQLGLVGMRERCEMIGGILTLESAPGTGATIVVEIPDAYPRSGL